MGRPISGDHAFCGEESDKMIITWPIGLADALDLGFKN
jgi:hypothetical protein